MLPFPDLPEDLLDLELDLLDLELDLELLEEDDDEEEDPHQEGGAPQCPLWWLLPRPRSVSCSSGVVSAVVAARRARRANDWICILYFSIVLYCY